MTQYPEINQVQKAGYTVVQKSPWHFHIVNGDLLINVWPTKRKWMVPYSGGASFYTNLLATCEEVLGKPGQEKKRDPWAIVKRLWKEEERRITPQQREAMEWRKEWHPVLVEYLTLV